MCKIVVQCGRQCYLDWIFQPNFMSINFADNVIKSLNMSINLTLLRHFVVELY